MATSNFGGNKYRSYMTPEDIETTQWIAGPPDYTIIDKFFEEGRTKVWPAGSLEEYVQNLVKTWEMELVHKANPDQYKTFDHKKCVLGVNGKKYFTLEETGKIGGGYNAFLQTSLPPKLRVYDPDQETNESSMAAFRQVFPRGFALEVVQVYSGPPVIVYKYRHWGYMEGSYKDLPPTGELIEVFGIAIFELNEESKIVKVEFFHDRGELLAGLIKAEPATPSGCPVMA
ncbi:pathogen-related protein-like [Salvia hispanica]|uniref:pathogen-related protein-like n=1 Tax=Salvia hispanica TaxID=49212 RepID=UPI0020097CD5|nr:pathogen-related protein-like [Salvia hispanica]